MLKNSLIQCFCAFDHVGMKVTVRNYEISGLKIRLGRLLFSHKEVKEQFNKIASAQPSCLVTLHVYMARSGTDN